MDVPELLLIIIAMGVFVAVIAGAVILGIRLSRGRRHEGETPRPGSG